MKHNLNSATRVSKKEVVNILKLKEVFQVLIPHLCLFSQEELEERLDVVEKELGSLRMSLKRCNVLKTAG